MATVLIRGDQYPGEDARLLREMFQLRHKAFKERLAWDVSSHEGMERDQFDALHPVYVLSKNRAGHVDGCWRLLPTTGPYMLKDIFGELLGGRAAPQAADVWEISRFAVLSPAKGPRTLGSVHRVTSDMLVTLFEFALQSNIRQVIAASEIRFERILRRAGLVTHRFAEPRPIGRTLAVAGWADVSDDTLLRIRTASCARRKAARTNLMPLTRSGSRSSERDPEFPHADAAG